MDMDPISSSARFMAMHNVKYISKVAQVLQWAGKNTSQAYGLCQTVSLSRFYSSQDAYVFL